MTCEECAPVPPPFPFPSCYMRLERCLDCNTEILAAENGSLLADRQGARVSVGADVGRDDRKILTRR